MKTTDIFKINRSSQRLNESIGKVFGKKINLESFDLPQLEDARNKLRTQISQVRSESGFNETVENDALTKAQWMLDAINAEIAEREEFIADAGQAEASYEEGFGSMEDEVKKLLDRFEQDAMEIGGYGDPDIKEIIKHLENGDAESAAEVVWYAYTDQDGGEFPQKEPLINDLEAEFEELVQGGDEDEGGETDDDYAMASAGFGSDEDYGTFPESTQGEEMRKVTEGEIQQASAIVTAKTMVDRVGRWIEELSGMENDTLLQLGDSIRDEMGADQAKNFISSVAPAIQQALESLKQTRETLSTGVRQLTGEEQPAEMLGSEPEAGADMAPAGDDQMNTPAEEPAPVDDEFAAAEPAAGGAEAAGREQRESIQYQNRLLKVLAG
jgi:hypothetical protein